MMLWEVALIIWYISGYICFFIFRIFYRKCDPVVFDKNDVIFLVSLFNCVCCIVISIAHFTYFLCKSGVGDWITYCWFDFWTTEVSLEGVLIGLIIICLPTFLIFISNNLKECECEAVYIRKGKYCRKCGKKRDA